MPMFIGKRTRRKEISFAVTEANVWEWIIGGGGLICLVWYVNRSVTGVYNKITKNREDADEKYVHRDVCQVQHRSVEKKLDEVSQDLKKLLHKNGIN